MNILKKIMVMFGASLSLASCQTSESISFVHEPSSEFYSDLNPCHENLTNFIDGGLLFAIDIKEVDSDIYWIWLGLYSKEDSKSVFIKRITLTGNQLQKDISINKSFILNKKMKKEGVASDLLTAEIDPIEINKKELLSFIDDKNVLEIEITYEMDSVLKKKDFYIFKKTEKRIVYPT